MKNNNAMKTILANRVKGEVNSWLSTGQQLLGILFFLLFGVGNVWGGVSGGGYVYLDASGWDTTKITQLAVVWTTNKADIWMYPASGSSMTHLRGTYLYYYHGSSSRWYDGSNYMRFFQGAGGAYNDYNGKIGELTGNGNYTPSFSYGINNNDTYFFGRASTSATAAIKTSSPYGYKGNNTAYTGINGVGTQSVAVKISTNDGSTWIDPTSTYTVPQAISLKTWKVTAQGTTTQQSTSIAKSQYATKSTSIASANVAYTAVTTLSLTGSINSNYVFDGWYVDDSRVSTSSTYSYEATAAKSVEARFIYETTYTITIANSVNASTSTKSVGATPKQITAPEIDGYYFTTWSAMPTGVTKTSGNLTDESIYISATKAATVTANYNAKTKVRLYYTNPGNFSAPKAYFWYSTTTSDNSGWPGLEMSSVTECGTTYYYAEYYKEDHPNWNRVIFNDNGNSATQTSDITFSNTTNNGQYNNAPASKSGTGSWTATPPARWAVAGSWDSYSTASNLLTCDDGTLYTEITTLTANTDYQFKLVDTYTSTWYGVTTATKITYENKAIAQTMNNTTGGSPNQTIKTAAAGTYRFVWDPSNKTVTVNYPTSYKVELEVGTVKGNKSAPEIYHTSYIPANKIASGSYVAEGTKVIFVIATSVENAAKTGYTWCGFFDNAAGSTPTQYTNNEVTTYNINSIAANAHVYACFYENDYNVYVQSSDATNAGTVAQSYMTAHKDTKMTIPSASAKTGFYFYNWTKTGTATLYSNTSATAAQINGVTATNAVTVTANFNPKWSLAGSGAALGNWATDANKFTTAYYQESSKWKGNKTITLAANTDYEIKMYDLQSTPHWYGTDHTAAAVHVYYANSGDSKSMSDTDESAKNLQVHSAAGGEYTFKWNVTDKSMQIVYPTSWYITTGQKTTGQSDNAGGSFTATDNADNDVKGGKFVANNATVTFVATPNTGYTFGGWYSNAACTTPYTAGGNISFSGEGNTTMVISSITAVKDVYALFNPKTYTVALTQTGAASTGTPSVTASYNTTAPTIASLPTAAQGYAFMGYYTAADGEGSQLVAANGTWQNVTGYTSGGKWIRNGGAELFAYFKKAEITNIAFTPGNIVAPSATVTVTATIEPTPVGPTTICWRVLYSNDNPLDPQPTFTPVSGGTVSFPAHSASGSYKVEATLRKGSGCGGEEIHTFTAPFQVAGDHTVTVQYKCGNTTIKAPASVTGKPLQWTAITAPEIVGYSFSKWVEGDGITIEGATDGEKASATINFKAIYDGKLTAVYTQKRMIYFYNTLNWENVYVYFYKDGKYWDNSNGTGTDPSYYSGSHNSAHKGQMLPVTEGSKIYYFDAEEASIPAGYTNVAFTEKQQDNCWYFYDNNKVVRRGDYQSTTMPLFVPLSDQPAVSKNGGAANYYCEGYWMNYPANSGYTLRIYNAWNANNATEASREYMIPFSEDVKMPLKQEVEVNSSGESWFIIYRNDGTYLEGSHTFKQTDHGDKKITSNADASKAKKMRLISDGSGIYTFTLTFRGDGGSPENYDYYLNVDFPAAVGDYRIVYSDNATWSNGAHSSGWYHPSDIIGKNTSETDAKEDIVSFFISHGSSPSMKFQRISAISESAGSYGQITWEDVPSGSITIPTSITASGVYNFIVTQPAGGASISLVKAEPYTGNYYIRTDCAGETKWNNFRSPDHLITYSEYSITHGGYSHYYTHWVQTDDKKNIQFCIANDYSSAISDTLIRENNSDPAWTNINNYIDEKGNILRNANVRFMWNQSTNKISRAYVDGAQGTGSNNFLYMLSEDNKIRKTDESALDDHKVFFSDNENWIYEANIQAQPKAAIKLLSNWGTSNTITQYFKGSATTTEDLIDGSGSNWYNIRLLYDFKTNRLVAAMVPTGNIDAPTPIHADVMFIREHQGDIDQLTFTNDGSITNIETAYAVMRFNKWTLNNKEKTGSHSPLASPKSIYERSLYYVSFPFRVKLSEVFGFGTYGQHWIIQRYRGDLRAQQGYWAESDGFWEFIWNRNGEVYLEPNEGYILTLETELLGETSAVWGPDSRSNQIELFFPSYGAMPTITNTSITQTLPAHKCTINRAATEGLPDTPDPSTSYNRTIFDSHWNIMSVPTYLNAENPSLVTTTWLSNDSCPKFLYTWNPDDNTLTATSGTGFMYHAMHAYTVQYYGNVTWTTSVSPAAAPQRNTEYRGEYEFCLEVQQDEQMIDRTFVRLSDDENVTAGFEFGEDMTKQFNSRKANIFTIAGNTSLGGNSLPLSTTQTTVVPVGVSIRNAGDYTFAIPEGTEGIGVTLVDNETGVRTSLSALDYTVSLPAGKHDNRFFLEISPIKTTPTGIEDVQGGNVQSTKVHKVMIDGILYIVKDGKIFDARGARLR